MKQSIDAGQRIELKDVGLFADGTAVKLVGEHTFALCRDLLDEIILVDTDDICGAVKDIYDDTRSITEPSGALALAGLKAYIAREACEGRTLIAINSGANMNFHRLRHVSERSELGEGNEGIFAVPSPNAPEASSNSSTPWAIAVSRNSTTATATTTPPTSLPASKPQARPTVPPSRPNSPPQACPTPT